jgi:hypothetical protein
MVSLTVSLEPELKKELLNFLWINWSEVGREQILKKDIFDRYIKSGELTDRDWEFCEQIDWHPVDELPSISEHVELLKKSLKETGKTYNSTEEFWKELDSK